MSWNSMKCGAVSGRGKRSAGCGPRGGGAPGKLSPLRLEIAVRRRVEYGGNAFPRRINAVEVLVTSGKPMATCFPAGSTGAWIKPVGKRVIWNAGTTCCARPRLATCARRSLSPSRISTMNSSPGSSSFATTCYVEHV